MATRAYLVGSVKLYTLKNTGGNKMGTKGRKNVKKAKKPKEEKK